jgi:hypothetical protein
MLKVRRQINRAFWAVTLLVAVSVPALAGPPLICHPFEIGGAQSLAWGNAAEWRGVRRDYDLNRLVGDTLALLAPETPVFVRMETLRRATVYAKWAQLDREVNYTVKDDRVANELLARVVARAQEAERRGVKSRADALALFDAGYLVEAYRQSTQGKAAPQYDAVAWVGRASQALGQSAETEFALALMLADKPERRAEQDAHFRRAVAGAGEGSLLARNLVRHFNHKGRTLGEMRALAGKAAN